MLLKVERIKVKNKELKAFYIIINMTFDKKLILLELCINIVTSYFIFSILDTYLTFCLECTFVLNKRQKVFIYIEAQNF